MHVFGSLHLFLNGEAFFGLYQVRRSFLPTQCHCNTHWMAEVLSGALHTTVTVSEVFCMLSVLVTS